MKTTKVSFIIGFAIFASFFGAGNLILPPYLGFGAGADWWLITLGFVISAVVLPIAAMLAHSKLQGTLLDFGKKVSPLFSLAFCLSVYGIAIALPAPRTAAVSHEMAIAPYFGTSSLLTSSLYFSLVFVFVMMRGKILEILGKFLTPLILIILALIIVLGLASTPGNMNPSGFANPFIDGLLEGYQTYDALGGLVMGAIVIISLNLETGISGEDKRWLIRRSSLIAGVGLFVVYLGLIMIGAFHNSEFERDITRPELLIGLSYLTLGRFGSAALGVLVTLACFSTAVAIVAGTSDFIRGIRDDSKIAFIITTIFSCTMGVLMGQMDVHYIINVALPALMFIYPLSVVLIVLNLLPDRYATPLIFRGVVLITFIFSIPDFLGFILPEGSLDSIKDMIPLGNKNLAWLLPSLLTFAILNLLAGQKLKPQ